MAFKAKSGADDKNFEYKTMSSPVFAAIADSVDGKADGYAEYDQGYYVDFALDNPRDWGGTVTGELWLRQDADYLYLAFIEPLALVDNSYGSNAVDWFKANVNKEGEITGYEVKGHKFDELKGSDRAGFVFKNQSGESVLDITVDYIDDHDSPDWNSGGVTDGEGSADPSGGEIHAATSLQWNYDQFGATNPLLFGNGMNSPETEWNQDHLSPSVPDDLDTIDYNDPDAVAAAYATTDGALSDWLFEVIYEVQVNRDLLGGFDINDDNFSLTQQFNPLIAHASPHKLPFGDNEAPGIPGDPILPPGGGTEPIPEPATMLLLGSGLIGLAGFRKKFKKNA